LLHLDSHHEVSEAWTVAPLDAPKRVELRVRSDSVGLSLQPDRRLACHELLLARVS
jgi:hypothetical protein